MMSEKQNFGHIPLMLYNTLGRQKMEFVPLDQHGKYVGMYTCGPTVYSYAHIGNLRSYIFEDILKRTLRYNGFEVKHIMNITDVGHLTDDADLGEDKMEKSAAREGKTAWEIAEKYTQVFKIDLRNLNIIDPDVWCKATDHIEHQIALVQKLEQNGFAYRIEDGIYYDTAKFPRYGELALLKIENLDPGKRVKLASGKRNPTDFALWKFSPTDKKRQMEWNSPWGLGFPGWHIECSAMSMHYLGEQFDIHCGGIDHIPVHHTNEIAQAEAVTSKQWVRYWLHGEFLLVAKPKSQGEANDAEQSQKMAKSEGNILTLDVLRERGYDPLVYRYFVLNAHYRKQLFFSDDAMEGAKNGYANLTNRLTDLEEEVARSTKQTSASDKKAAAYYGEAFLKAIDDDLNMPQALAVAWDMLHDKTLSARAMLEMITDFDRVLGLRSQEQPEEIPAHVQNMIEERQKARQDKNWPMADEMRQKIKEAGYQLLDTREGVKIRKSK